MNESPGRPKTQLLRRTTYFSVAARLLFLNAGVLFPIAAHAQDEGAQFQQDPVQQVAARVLVALAVIGIAVVIYSLIRYRGSAVGPASWGVLVVGAVAFPLLITGVGTILVFQRAERVEFCASCHLTMQPFVDDLKNPTSNSLAALHFRNRYIPDDQCYACHTSYGLFGTVEAKKEGLNDVYHYYTRTFHLPIKLKHPYPNNDCLKCHGGSAKWIATHQDYKDSLLSGEATCMQCHAESNPAHNIAQNAAPVPKS